MYSRRRGPGAVHLTENRRSMCPLTWVPSPRISRPPDAAWRSQAVWATTVGLRGKATAIAVPRLTRRVCSAASARGRNGSCRVSAVQSPSKPRASASRAMRRHVAEGPRWPGSRRPSRMPPADEARSRRPAYPRRARARCTGPVRPRIAWLLGVKMLDLAGRPRQRRAALDTQELRIPPEERHHALAARPAPDRGQEGLDQGLGRRPLRSVDGREGAPEVGLPPPLPRRAGSRSALRRNARAGLPRARGSDRCRGTSCRRR